MNPSGVHHFAVKVRDLPRVEPFYREILGLPVLRRWPGAAGGERSVWLDVGGGSFLALEATLADRRLEGDEEDPGLHLVALTIRVSERAAWEGRFAAAAVPVYRRTSFTLYVRDPEGNRVALSHHPDAAPDADDHV